VCGTVGPKCGRAGRAEPCSRVREQRGRIGDEEAGGHGDDLPRASDWAPRDSVLSECCTSTTYPGVLSASAWRASKEDVQRSTSLGRGVRTSGLLGSLPALDMSHRMRLPCLLSTVRRLDLAPRCWSPRSVHPSASRCASPHATADGRKQFWQAAVGPEWRCVHYQQRVDLLARILDLLVLQ
jgi:hypothetical protein